MHRVLLGLVLATAVLGTPAEAAKRHKHHRAHRVPHVAAQPYYPAPLLRTPQTGPAWSGPNQCWTDEGYGRWSPCDNGGRGR